MLTLALGVILAVGFSVASRTPTSGSGGSVPATAILARSAPPFALTAHNRDRVRLDDFTGHPLVLFFGYTHCPDVCSVGLARVGEALGRLGDDGDDLRILFVTVDPERDHPKRLARYLGGFDARIIGLTGSATEIEQVLAAYQVTADIVDVGNPDDYPVIHTSRVLTVDTDGLFGAGFSATSTVDEMVRGLREVL